MPSRNKRILITGGAGFIGTHLVNALSSRKWEVVVLDALIKQVHRSGRWNPPPHVKFIKGDVCNKSRVRESLEGVNYIVHLAAETGVGQSAYEISRYVKTNELGTAVLLEEASRVGDTLAGVVIASSRAIYGEGRYRCGTCGFFYPSLRKADKLIKGIWEPQCPTCQRLASPLSSVEEQTPNPVSVYGITKHNQEELLRQFSESFSIPAIALRFQNVYGPGQSLTNPYTGILALFSTRLLSGNPIYIYEDGNERRDFIYVEDTVQSIVLALKKGFSKIYEVYNVGSGIGTSVEDIARLLLRIMKREVPVIIAGKYRVGDIRHAWADITKIQRDFDFKPRYPIERGLRIFAQWARKQPLPIDRYKKTEAELINKGLLLESRETSTD
ncbi:NAD dependent epimerase/dehydratase family protein [Candidatus Sulfobium mesophilum]|uniref:NAD dependent epimerase/dehydratase family protein n=1 Tax=Candidatus Sulfobium mesophilum TaxID=2016548 RepID=A0A2U3QDJ5_9BACT|nr:NAD dependent epimerase/dehydratase family protein [Candidatus Sulfobium mesophilum]